MKIKTGLYSDKAYIEILNAHEKLRKIESSDVKEFYSKIVSITRSGICEVIITVSSNRTYCAPRMRLRKEYEYVDDHTYYSKGSNRGKRKWTGRKILKRVYLNKLNNIYAKEGSEMRFLRDYSNRIKNFISPLLYKKLRCKVVKDTNELRELIGTPFIMDNKDYCYQVCQKELKDIFELYTSSVVNLIKLSLDMVNSFNCSRIVRNMIHFDDLHTGTVIEVPTIKGVERFTILNASVDRKDGKVYIKIIFDRGYSRISIDNLNPWKVIDYKIGYIKEDQFVLQGDSSGYESVQLKINLERTSSDQNDGNSLG